MANDEEDAKHRLFSTLGSRHRVTRRSITIDSIEQIDPSISKEAKVISAFRNDREIPSLVVTETTSSEDE